MFHPQGPTFWELARQALSSTERGYDLLAPKFEFTPFRTPDEILSVAATYFGPPRSIDSALDVCCGTGAAMRFLRPVCRHRVVGIDFSRGMLDVATRQLNGAAGEAELQFVVGDVLEMAYRDEFDLAVCFGALGHFRQREHAILMDRVAEALKPGGRFLFPSSYFPPRLSTRYWLSRGFNAAMHVRNFLLRPPFIMYYLRLLVPEATRLLNERGFRVEVHEQLFPAPYQDLCLVEAVKR